MIHRKNKSKKENDPDRNFSESDWVNAPVESTTGSGSSSPSSHHEVEAPEINLSSIPRRASQEERPPYNAVASRMNSGFSTEGYIDNSSSFRPGPNLGDSTTSRRVSFFGANNKDRIEKANDDDASTMAPSSSASRSSYASSGTNIWTKLLGGQSHEGLWDGLNSKTGDAFDDADCEDESQFSDEFYDFTETSFKARRKACSRATKNFGLSLFYETRHFMNTLRKNPHLLILPILVTGTLLGVGLVAVNAERDRAIQEGKSTAEFIARETAEWFQNEFRKAMLPLYSIQQAVMHSGYFNELADKIGDYPQHIIPKTDYIANSDTVDPFNPMPLDTMNGATPPPGRVYRNLTGICDDPLMQQRWHEIVAPINKDSGLDDGSAFAYRLAPRNVFCLYEHDDPQVAATKDTDIGFDVGVSYESKFWKKTALDLFGLEDPDDPYSRPGMSSGQPLAVFGPFGQPDKEVVCAHLPIYTREFDPKMPLNVYGNIVENGWGFVANALDWRKLKERSNIYERFADCNVEFILSRKEDGVELASSPYADLLTEDNSIVIETESQHGTWQNQVGSISGWEPTWYHGAVVAVVLTSIILGFLVASVLVERQLHRDLTRKMLPRRAIAKLHRGQTVLEKFNLVTIFFSDIVGFTSLAGTMRPIQVMKMLNELYTELDKLVEKHQVYKVETIGDAYMVVGGAPNRVPAPLAAERVALFAIDALDFVKNFRTNDGDQIFIRAGLASGPTVAGVVGEAMPRYCFFGDTVNFASRMESTSKKMKIQVAEITSRLLQDSPNMDFNMEKRMEGGVAGVEIKGKGHQITSWVKGASPRDPSRKVIDITPRDVTRMNSLPHISEDDSVVAVEEARDAEQVCDHSQASFDISMYTSDEIYGAMSAQQWELIGHCEESAANNVLAAATNDRQTMILRASSLLEHHLSRVFKSRDADSKLPGVVKNQISQFVGTIASTYNNVHYHNLAHALHVMTSMNKLLIATLTDNPLDSFSLVFSALVHDAGHTGMSNQILRDSHHPLADKYSKDVPIAERLSIEIALNVLFREEYEALRMAILPGSVDKIQFAKCLFQSILVTDIATPARVKLGIKRYEVCQDDEGIYDPSLCPLAPHMESVLKGAELKDSDKEEHSTELIITRAGLAKCVKNEHLMLLSDVGHLMQGWETFVKWNFRLFKELDNSFKNGFCEDPRSNWPQGNFEFLDKYILPLAQRSTIYFKDTFGEALVENALANRKLWEKHGSKATEIMEASLDQGESEGTALLKLYELPTL